MGMATTHEISGYLGTDDEHDSCDCCGKTGLKSTVALLTTDGDEVFYGVTCAARALGVANKVVKASAKSAQKIRDEAAAAERKAQWERDNAEFVEFVGSFVLDFSRDWDGQINMIQTCARTKFGTIGEALKSFRFFKQVQAEYAARKSA